MSHSTVYLVIARRSKVIRAYLDRVSAERFVSEGEWHGVPLRIDEVPIYSATVSLNPRRKVA